MKTFQAPENLIDPTMDFVFKRIFGVEENKDLLISLLNAVLQRPEVKKITEIKYQQTEAHREYQDLKGIVLDIQVRDLTGRWFDIEIQCQKHLYFPERVLLYWSRVYGAQLKRGQAYTKLNPVISVIFTDFVTNQKNSSFHSKYQIKETKEGFLFSEHLEIHVVELPKYSKPPTEAKDSLEKWVSFLKEGKNMTQEETSVWATPELEKAWDQLEKLSHDPDYRWYYESEFKRIMDEQSLYLQAQEEGIKEGIEKGIKEGIEKGIKEGIEKGIEKTALRMINKGFSLKEIKDVTGISTQRLEELKESHQLLDTQ